MHTVFIQKHENFNVLRDDLLVGGTKRRFLMPALETQFKDAKELVYASPVYGGFQIALAAACKAAGRKATIFCAKRKELFTNTKKAAEHGADIKEIKPGYLSVVQKRARDYVDEKPGERVLLAFGADYNFAINHIAATMAQCSSSLGGEPEEIWCAVGSGTLIKGILKGTARAQINGVLVGKEWEGEVPERITLHRYPKPFQWELKAVIPFPSCANYDRKAFSFAKLYHKHPEPFFWNVM